MNKIEKVGLITLGCDKNTVDSERLLKQLKYHRIKIVEPEVAETLIINTCGFVEDAKQESINTILMAAKLKQDSQLNKIIVFGCLSQRYKEDLQKEIPEVDVFLGVEDYNNILKEFNKDIQKNLLNERIVTTSKHYSFLKISEGCNNACSFCAIPLIRGKYVSQPLENLIYESNNLAEQGVKELILVAQDTTYYGLDIYKKRVLPELINKISEIKNIEWIRLLYTYPNNFPVELIEVIKNNPKVCKYLDIPLQHISDIVLKNMKRGISSKNTRKLLDLIRTEIPELTLRTTFIVGHPGEGDKEFNELIKFIEEYKFERAGAFKYSPEEGTKGFLLGDEISDEVKEERLSILMETQKEISLDYNQKQIGKKKKVIIDSRDNDYFIARSQSETPEVDGEILIPSKKRIKIGQFYDVEIYDANEYDLYANILKV